MIEETLNEYMEKVEIFNKDISIYRNEEKGLMYPLGTASLLARVDFLQLEQGTTKQPGEFEKLLYEQKIEKKDYKECEIEKIVPKYEITKNEADKYTITTKKTKGVKLYNVSNQLGIHSTFEDQEEAFKLCDEINKKVMSAYGIL